MQLTPHTFRWLSDDVLHEYLDDGLRYDPETNIRYGTCLLSRLYYVYGDWETVFAAYNAGSGHVDEWLNDPRYSSDGVHLTAIPFEETREYIKRVTGARSMYDTLYPEGRLAPSETAADSTADTESHTTIMEGN
jgi:soluble lytic murein transglycosylase